MLTANNLSFSRTGKKIFSNLGFSLSTSSVLVVKGKNGTGKTSLLRVIAGLSKSDGGEILWGGENIENFRDDFNGDMQFLGHKNFLKQDLTILENLRFYAKLANTENAISSAINYFKLGDLADQKVKTLSAGWQKRVMLAKLLACPATIWLLDEPSNNLDDEGKELLYGLLKNRSKEDGLIIMTSHDKKFFDLGPQIDLGDY